MFDLCAVPTCALPGRHRPGCEGGLCRGCLPARAQDGLRLCPMHLRHIPRDAIEAAALWAELALHLTGGGGGYSEVRATNPQPGLNIDLVVAEHRAAIRSTLVSWTRLIAEDRGISLPWRHVLIALPPGVHGPLRRVQTINHRTAALGRFIATHGIWLAAQEFAAEAAGELTALVRTGRSLRQPSGTRVVAIGPCPQRGGEGLCNGELRGLIRPTDSLLPSAVACDADETHTWDSTQWTKLGRTMRSAA